MLSSSPKSLSSPMIASPVLSSVDYALLGRAERLKRWRTLAGRTMSELASACNCSVPTYASFESGRIINQRYLDALKKAGVPRWVFASDFDE